MRPTKLVAAFAGVLMIIASFGLTVAGGAVLAVAGEDGWVSAGPIRLTTDAVALVGEDIDIDLGDRVTGSRTFVGWDAIPAQFEVSSRNGKAIFVGVASQADLDAYLAGVSIDRVELFRDDAQFRAETGATSVTPPGREDFWVATAVDGVLDWDMSNGEWAIVALNADGSQGVDVSVRGSAQVPFIELIGGGLLVVGLIGVGLGGLLTYYGVRRVGLRTPAPTTPTPSTAA